jgi:hypothetical protein
MLAVFTLHYRFTNGASIGAAHEKSMTLHRTVFKRTQPGRQGSGTF